MDREYATNLIRSQTLGLSDEDVNGILDRMEAESLEFGQNTSVWHEHTRWIRDNDDRPPCVHCGSKIRGGIHELCRVRAARGRPTPPLGDEIECPCSPCRRAAQ